jgi:hypothetical protein
MINKIRRKTQMKIYYPEIIAEFDYDYDIQEINQGIITFKKVRV